MTLCHLGNWFSEQHVSDALDNVPILTHDVPKGIADASVGVGLVMHGEADVHGTIQVGRGFHFGECGALDGVDVCHVPIISTGSAAMRPTLCQFANWSEAAPDSQ